MEQRLTILSVDDDPDCRSVIRAAMSDACDHARFMEASSGLEALERLSQQGHAAPRPDLICLDMEMPGMSGMELLAKIKADVKLRDIPVVMVTGVDDNNVRATAMALGASGYVAKTSDPRLLLRKLHETMEKWLEPTPADTTGTDK